MARAPFCVSERTTKHGVAWDARFFGVDGAVTKTIRIADAKNRTQAIRIPLTYVSRMHRLPNPLQYLDKLAENERERGILSLGEIRGLKQEDVDRENHVITVRGNYVSHAEGLKKPKWGHTRVVPYTDSPYLLWNAQHIKHPVDFGTITKGFYAMLKEIGIDNDARQKLEEKLRAEEQKRQEKEEGKVASSELVDGDSVATEVVG